MPDLKKERKKEETLKGPMRGQRQGFWSTKERREQEPHENKTPKQKENDIYTTSALGNLLTLPPKFPQSDPLLSGLISLQYLFCAGRVGKILKPLHYLQLMPCMLLKLHCRGFSSL